MPQPTESNGKDSGEPDPNATTDPATGAGNESESENDEDLNELDPKIKAVISKKNREAQNLRERLRATEDKAKKYDEFLESQKTAEQKAQEEREALLFQNTTLQDQMNRFQACVAAGFSPEDISEMSDRLKGDTPEELLADAKKLKERWAGGTRRPDPSQGRGSNSGNPSPAALFGELLKKKD